MLLHNSPFLFFIFFYVFTCCSCLGLSLCNSFILSSTCVCKLSFFSIYCLFAYIKSLSYISHHFSPLFIHLSSDLTKVTLSFCTVITCLCSFPLLVSFGLWVGPCTPTRGGTPYALVGMAQFRVEPDCWACLVSCLLLTAPWVLLHQ